MTISARRHGLSYYESSIRDFSQVVAGGKARTARLEEPANDQSEVARLGVALEELRIHQEELDAADEELHAQLEALADTTVRVEKERDRYRELFDAAPDAYFVTDRQGIVQDVNAAGSSLLAIEPRFLYGKPLTSFIDAADVRLLRDALDQLRSTRSVTLEMRLKPRKNEALWHEIKGTSVEENSAYLWIARSINARRASSDALVAAHGDLSDLAAERTSELARANRDKHDLLLRERQLRASMEDSNAAKDRILTGLAHDLRPPIHAVLGWTQLLRREKLAEAARDRALATIERTAQIQMQIVEELLDMARIGGTTTSIVRQAVDLDDVVVRAVQAVTNTAFERGVDLRLERDERERRIVTGERRRLEQIVHHLLENALQSTRRNEWIAVSLSSSDDSARLVVSNNGRGISAEALPHVFAPFQRAMDGASASDQPGLGLYFVKYAALVHGGDVTAESDGVDRGARLIVRLPLNATPHEIPSPAPTPGSGASGASGAADQSLLGVRVLVVDDDQDGRELMAFVLGQRGAVVTTAADPKAALLAFDGSPQDVVVSDIAMPDGGGLELVETLRARKHGRATFVAVSGFSSPAEVDDALRSGFDAHLAKPIDPGELADVVHDAAKWRAR